MSPAAAGLVLVALLALAGVTCREPTGPQPGALSLRLTMPSANSGQDAAVLFTVNGPAAPTGVSAGTGLQVFAQTLAPSAKYVVTGTLTSNATIVTLEVPDTRSTYTATVEQVAATNYALRASLTGYGLTVSR